MRTELDQKLSLLLTQCQHKVRLCASQRQIHCRLTVSDGTGFCFTARITVIVRAKRTQSEFVQTNINDPQHTHTGCCQWTLCITRCITATHSCSYHNVNMLLQGCITHLNSFHLQQSFLLFLSLHLTCISSSPHVSPPSAVSIDRSLSPLSTCLLLPLCPHSLIKNRPLSSRLCTFCRTG